jgi:hypothetical protein
MSRLTALRARLRLLFSRDKAESRMNQEFRFHLEMETEKNIRAGMSPEVARRRAALDFGATQAHREEMRDDRGFARGRGAAGELGASPAGGADRSGGKPSGRLTQFRSRGLVEATRNAAGGGAPRPTWVRRRRDVALQAVALQPG